jgi:hypothetical protein
MNTPLQSAAKNRPADLDAIVQEIVRLAGPEKILLISAGYDYKLTENIFMKNPVQTFQNCHYHLLVLSEEKEKKSLIMQELTLTGYQDDRQNLQLHVMDIHEFNKQVEAGDEYLGFILLNAMLWYDKGRIPLSDPKLSGG